MHLAKNELKKYQYFLAVLSVRYRFGYIFIYLTWTVFRIFQDGQIVEVKWNLKGLQPL